MWFRTSSLRFAFLSLGFRLAREFPPNSSRGLPRSYPEVGETVAWRREQKMPYKLCDIMSYYNCFPIPLILEYSFQSLQNMVQAYDLSRGFLAEVGALRPRTHDNFGKFIGHRILQQINTSRQHHQNRRIERSPAHSVVLPSSALIRSSRTSPGTCADAVASMYASTAVCSLSRPWDGMSPFKACSSIQCMSSWNGVKTPDPKS